MTTEAICSIFVLIYSDNKSVKYLHVTLIAVGLVTVSPVDMYTQ